MNKLTTGPDIAMMRRAIRIAEGGGPRVSPNPLVGAVITARGRIIGEGFHRMWGGPHAEVNAIRSVREEDRPLLREATIYVTLEPCSHYGKTPPCAKLIIDTGIPRVVVGAPDPNPLVSGRGIRMLREAGVDVTENVLREECEEQNRRFMTAQRKHRPWIQLKWAETADGYIGAYGADGKPAPITVSGPVTLGLMHGERSMADAILAGTGTVISDNPSLTLRHRPGKDPLKVTFSSPRLPSESKLATDPATVLLPSGLTLPEQMEWIRKEKGINSLMVEGGAETLQRFIDADLFDEIRVERSRHRLGTEGVKAPSLPEGTIAKQSVIQTGESEITTYRRMESPHR